jgi:hypothetical protein
MVSGAGSLSLAHPSIPEPLHIPARENGDHKIRNIFSPQRELGFIFVWLST